MRYSRSYLSKEFNDRFGPPTELLTGDEQWACDDKTVLTLSRVHVFGASVDGDKRENVWCSFSLPLSVIDNMVIPHGKAGEVVFVKFLDGDGAELATIKMKLKGS